MSSSKTNQIKKLLSVNLTVFIFSTSFINAQAKEVFKEKTDPIETSYLKSKDELKDYILDTGDILDIKFVNTPDISGLYTIDEQGEIYFERIKYAYVRGLTITEFTQLLEKRYAEFLLNPEIYIRVKTFKPIRVAIRGEVRSPGLIQFPAYISTNVRTQLDPLESKTFSYDSKIYPSNIKIERDSSSISTNKIKRKNDYVTTLSNAILGANGLTSYSDISKIEIVRDIPIGKGGGRKRAIIDFLPYIKKADTTNDIRLFDGDYIFIPSLKEQDPSIIPNSILSGLSPKYINVTISGKVEKPGKVKIPIEGSLSDVINLTGPRKPLSGKVYLIRYNKDGTLLRESIRYSSTAKPGSTRNPYLLAGDLITVENSILGRTSSTLKAISDPFLGIYATKELYETIRSDF